MKRREHCGCAKGSVRQSGGLVLDRVPTARPQTPGVSGGAEGHLGKNLADYKARGNQHRLNQRFRMDYAIESKLWGKARLVR